MNTLSTFWVVTILYKNKKMIFIYPLKTKFLGNKIYSLSKGITIVEDDEGIGTDVLILSGAHIGKGAVIGARTVVSGSIPTYAIMAGNPGEIIKYRFNKEIINISEQIDYCNIHENFFIENIDFL